MKRLLKFLLICVMIFGIVMFYEDPVRTTEFIGDTMISVGSSVKNLYSADLDDTQNQWINDLKSKTSQVIDNIKDKQANLLSNENLEQIFDLESESSDNSDLNESELSEDLNVSTVSDELETNHTYDSDAYKFGDQLDEKSRKIYDVLYNHLIKDREIDTKIEITDEDTLSVFPNTVWNEAGQKQFSEECGQIIRPAFHAFVDDYPEVFWLNKITWNYHLYYTDISEQTVMLSQVDMTLYSSGADPSQTEDFFEAIDLWVEELQAELPDSADRYDTVKAIHDKILNEVEYRFLEDGSTIDMDDRGFSAATVFLDDDKRVVCEGYAKAFKILCNRFNIPCIIVKGEGLSDTVSDHMWNYVQMDNELWYGVDCTWDDQNKIYYNYFLVGSDTKVGKPFPNAKKTFLETHIPLTDTFTYPELSFSKYKK